MPLKKIKRAFRGARKAVKKLIPKEIRPAIPYIAAAYLGPGAQGIGSLTGRELAIKAAIAGGTRFATDDEADLKDVLRTSALAVTPDVASSGLGTLGRKFAAAGDTADKATLATKLGDLATRTSEGIKGASNLKTIGAQTAVDATAKLAEIQQDELDAYNRKLAEQGITDKSQRRAAIRNIYLGVGYDEDYVDSMLDRYGYKGGGITMSDEQFATLLDSLKDDEDEDEMSISEYTDMANKGFQQAYGMESLFDQAPKPMPIRPGFDEGGDIMSPEEYFKEKEKADDVPARLSKNEFVMTADAVRGAGGGDVNEGARRMYQTMDKLEAMA